VESAMSERDMLIDLAGRGAPFVVVVIIGSMLAV
jgi:hypothetical protein